MRKYFTVIKHGDRDGFVLFSVIWISGLLAVIATTFAISTKLHVKSQANLGQAYQAELIADGLVRLVSYRLAQAPLADAASSVVASNGMVVSCVLADYGDRGGRAAQAFVAVQDQAGLIDLNKTSPRVLTDVLGRLGVSAAEEVGRAIVDFRDEDERQYDGEGEEESLVERGPSFKNAAFQSVEEIAQAVPDRLVRTTDLTQFFTVYALQEGIDPSVAPARLKALVEMTSASSTEDRRLPTALSPRKAFAVDIEVRFPSSVSFRRVAVITLLRLPDRPYALLEWRQGERPRDEKGAATGMPCGALAASRE